MNAALTVANKNKRAAAMCMAVMCKDCCAKVYRFLQEAVPGVQHFPAWLQHEVQQEHVTKVSKQSVSRTDHCGYFWGRLQKMGSN